MTSATAFIVLILLFVKKVTCDVGSAVGYNYPQPQPPVQFDEPSTPPNIYIPPIFQDEIIPSQVPPVFIPTYLPPIVYPPVGTPPNAFDEEDTIVLPNPTPGSLYLAPVPQMRILNMSCVMDTSFRSVFRFEARGAGAPQPVMDNGSEGCIRAGPSGTFSMEMESSKKIAECGVRRCTSGTTSRANMCVIVRMPTVRGLKLPEDGLVTLQCTPQDTVVSHTKHIRLGPTSINRGRSSNNAVVASGGSQRSFDSRIILLRRSSGSTNFDQPLQPGSVVQLGEELVLRAVVQDGDGWKFSRMGPVMVRSSSSQKSVTLIEENGCRSAGIKSICPFQPRQVTPLDTLLNFRAFLFQGSSRGDDMLLSVRMLGCIYSQDCYQNGVCNEANLVPPLRFKRNTNHNPTSTVNDTTNWETQFEFKVQVPQEMKLTTSGYLSKEFLVLASMFALCLFLIIILLSVYFKRKGK